MIGIEGQIGLDLAGMIIWIGSVFSYVMYGIIINIVADIPMRMGHGGWKFRRKK